MAVFAAALAALALAAASAAAADSKKVNSQAGVIDGANPVKYNPSDPIILFIIQTCLIVVVCHAVHWPLSKIRQPRVIAEVVGGIILGPSVMGHVPGFRDAIFPAESLPNLNNVANLGLILYLFLIGLETDVGFLLSNWRIATSVAVAGLALPFGAGCALAWGVYQAFRDDPGVELIRFPVYMLFIGIAIAITAFPVLCRILTELKLLDTSVGVITLSAGVANDVVGWILLALCVALVNAGSGLSGLWILLCCLGYMLLLILAIKPALRWFLRRTGSIDNDPSQSVISIILLLAFASAFFTGIIGIHPIFGGFMTGLVVPRENRFNIRVTEKLEDIIGAIFLPLYFTLSGLNTNLGLLDTGTAWGYVVATTIVALAAKILGASLAARLSGLVWRESMTIGVLMSCKGLVELIVLNIGLHANILSVRTFTIFVVMALLTTFATTPLVSYLYPPWYQKKLAAWKRGEIDWETGAVISPRGHDGSGQQKQAMARVGKLLVFLRLDSIAALLHLLSLFGSPDSSEPPPSSGEESSDGSVFADGPKKAVWVHGVRYLQLTDRDSSVMTVSQAADYSRNDPVVNTLRTVGQQLHNLAASGEVAVMPETRFAEVLLTQATQMASDLLLLPWSDTGGLGDAQALPAATADDRTASSSYGVFVKSVLDSRDHNVAVFFPRSDGSADGKAPRPRQQSVGSLHEDFASAAPLSRKPYHIFLAYFGSDDDKLALRIVLQLCEGSRATATIMQVSATATATATHDPPPPTDDFFALASAKLPASAAARVTFSTAPGATTMEELLHHAASETRSAAPDPRAPTLVVVGRGSGAGVDPGKLAHGPREDLDGCLGAVAAHYIAGGVRADLLVVQSKRFADT